MFPRDIEKLNPAQGGDITWEHSVVMFHLREMLQFQTKQKTTCCLPGASASIFQVLVGVKEG